MFLYNSIKVPLFVSLSHCRVLLLMRKLMMMKWGQQWKAVIGSELIICLGLHRTRKNYIRKRKMLLNDKQIWCLTAVRGVGGRRKNVLAFSIPSAGPVCSMNFQLKKFAGLLKPVHWQTYRSLDIWLCSLAYNGIVGCFQLTLHKRILIEFHICFWTSPLSCTARWEKVSAW